MLSRLVLGVCALLAASACASKVVRREIAATPEAVANIQTFESVRLKLVTGSEFIAVAPRDFGHAICNAVQWVYKSDIVQITAVEREASLDPAGVSTAALLTVALGAAMTLDAANDALNPDPSPTPSPRLTSSAKDRVWVDGLRVVNGRVEGATTNRCAGRGERRIQGAGLRHG